MFRRTALALLTIIALAAGRAEAVTIRDLIELSRAGLSDQVLLALIDVDGGVFQIDTTTLKQLKDAGVSEAVIVGLIRSGRTPRVQEPAPGPAPEYTAAPEPDMTVIGQPDESAAAPAPFAVPYPVAVPVYVGVPTRIGSASRRRPAAERRFDDNTVTTFPTDVGALSLRVPPAHCVKAAPVYWGFGGKLRPDSWQPPPTVVCR
jgi:hypothetical protein